MLLCIMELLCADRKTFLSGLIGTACPVRNREEIELHMYLKRRVHVLMAMVMIHLQDVTIKEFLHIRCQGRSNAI